MMKTLVRLFGILAFSLTITAGAAEKDRFNFTVVCSDPALKEQVAKGISERLARANVEVSSNFPRGKLFVYLTRDVEDRKNLAGVSVAVAHVSNVDTALLALETINQKKEPVPERLASMLREEGFLQYMNVAHMDEASPQQIAILLDSLVSTFVAKYQGPRS